MLHTVHCSIIFHSSRTNYNRKRVYDCQNFVNLDQSRVTFGTPVHLSKCFYAAFTIWSHHVSCPLPNQHNTFSKNTFSCDAQSSPSVCVIGLSKNLIYHQFLSSNRNRNSRSIRFLWNTKRSLSSVNLHTFHVYNLGLGWHLM